MGVFVLVEVLALQISEDTVSPLNERPPWYSRVVLG